MENDKADVKQTDVGEVNTDYLNPDGSFKDPGLRDAIIRFNKAYEKAKAAQNEKQ